MKGRLKMLKDLVKEKDGFLCGSINIEQWSDFFDNKQGIEIIVGGEETADCVKEMHENAYEYLMANQEKMLNEILNRLLEYYPELRKLYDYYDSEKEQYMPDVVGINDFKHIIKLRRVYILNIDVDNVAYSGFGFSCSWDEEQGLGVMTHKNRVVEIGGEDTAFLSWVANKDKESKQKS